MIIMMIIVIVIVVIVIIVMIIVIVMIVMIVDVEEDFPGKFESSNLGRDNLSREIGLLQSPPEE